MLSSERATHARSERVGGTLDALHSGARGEPAPWKASANRWVAVAFDAAALVAFVSFALSFALMPPDPRGTIRAAAKKAMPVAVLALREAFWIMARRKVDPDSGMSPAQVAARVARFSPGDAMCFLAHALQCVGDVITERVDNFGPAIVACVCLFALAYSLLALAATTQLAPSPYGGGPPERSPPALSCGCCRGPRARSIAAFAAVCSAWTVACPLAMKYGPSGNGAIIGLVAAGYLAFPTAFFWASRSAAASLASCAARTSDSSSSSLGRQARPSSDGGSLTGNGTSLGRCSASAASRASSLLRSCCNAFFGSGGDSGGGGAAGSTEKRAVVLSAGAALAVFNSAVFVFAAAAGELGAPWYTPIELLAYWSSCALVSCALVTPDENPVAAVAACCRSAIARARSGAQSSSSSADSQEIEMLAPSVAAAARRPSKAAALASPPV
jgi:hypothetical protein